MRNITIHLVPKRVKNLVDLKKWLSTVKFNLPKNFTGRSDELTDAIGIRHDCAITKNVSELSQRGPRWTTYTGIAVYYNF